MFGDIPRKCERPCKETYQKIIPNQILFGLLDEKIFKHTLFFYLPIIYIA